MNKVTDRDTELDTLSAQVRQFKPLRVDEVAKLLIEAKEKPHGRAHDILVQHHLNVALNAALAWHGQGLEVPDLYQEASAAVVIAIEEHAARSGKAADLQSHVEKIVELGLDAALEREKIAIAAEQKIVHDVETLQIAELKLRRELGREATTIELAASLEWSVEHLAQINHLLRTASEQYDLEMLQFLDDPLGDVDEEVADGY